MSEISGETENGIIFTINDMKYSLSGEAQLEETLLNFIRERLKFKDVKCGCEKGFCGSCAVIVNGASRKSCALKLKNLGGAVIKTPSYINSPALSKYGELMRRHGAVQCGFCFPGITSSLESKLAGVENPSEKEVIDSLSGHVCRCTGYIPIIEAAQERGIAQNHKASRDFSCVGNSPVREESGAKISGSAVYADDIEFENMLHVYVLRSEHARAKILAIDTAEAEKAPGAALVLTHKGLPGAAKFGILKHDQPVLCSDRVSFRGDAVALVAAETIKQARDAAKLIKVNYEPLEPVFSAEESLREGAPVLSEDGNIICQINLRSKEDVSKFREDKGFVFAEGAFAMQAIEHAYMEPECSVANYDAGSCAIRLYAGSQNIHSEKEEIAHILGVPAEKVEIQLTATGGGFGGKEDLTTQPYSALAALLTKRPCKYRMSRDESILCSTKKHPFDIRISISADKNGLFGGISVKAVSDAGPYASLSQIVLTRFATHILGPYTWRSYDVSVTGARTNNLIAGAMRGFGVNQACYAVESMIDRLAAKLGLTPVEIRRGNMIEDGKIMGLGELAQNSAGLGRSFEAVLAEIDFGGIERFNSENVKVKRSAGIALAYKNMGLGNNSPRDVCSVRIAAVPGKNKIIVYTAASDIGQGLYNILRQIAAETAGLGIDSIEISWGDTAAAPSAGVTSASRQTFMSGNAVLKAVKEFYGMLAAKIASQFNADAGPVKLKGDKIIYPDDFTGGAAAPATIWDYIGRFEKSGIELIYKFDAPATSELTKAGAEGFKSHFGYSYAAHGVIVEACPETKKFKIIKIVAAHDAGRALNPVSLEGQIIGGVVMGLGYAVSENLKVENGMPDERGLAAMGLLKAKDVPPIVPIIIECPHPEGPYGARGIGEISTVPVAAALCNALRHATGLDFDTLPINLNKHGYKYEQTQENS
ncbi:MAG: hypothetical protein A2008_01375 [Candidatus Wallbacteria bacterium GWC2_49_35]|uniref:2Fe-2S ferredoxin-type domain-containing protein n=1 Tax=Candidatus Wallbacteria bacterium GWC2_49_35 TaxID=1817813 RepID=A0A1F7X143_9BACT|nr:MAG: hypothetical protein A2008_01375 [Candidatus Wallbacteria bacterium GWC2_49_35]HBC76783.1 hypothetical protein [Candidatus Wallbacteria bacterium]